MLTRRSILCSMMWISLSAGIVNPIEAKVRKGKGAVGAYGNERTQQSLQDFPVIDSEEEEEQVSQHYNTSGFWCCLANMYQSNQCLTWQWALYKRLRQYYFRKMLFILITLTAPDWIRNFIPSKHQLKYFYLCNLMKFKQNSRIFSFGLETKASD